MTALEQQLTTALRRLSEQYAQEQQRQTAQVEQLAGRMTRLAADYTALAETLRVRWN